MAAWAASPFRGVGIYIGGENGACSQPNLSASWVSAQTTAGWHLIPTYVGLQAPTSSLQQLRQADHRRRRPAQGMAAAEDAVAEATAIGDRRRQPDLLRHGGLLADHERHRRRLAFLDAWTEKLHAARLRLRRLLLERLRDRRPRRRSSAPPTPPRRHLDRQLERREDTLDPVVPSTAWPDHQRIHQFRGGHDETYGGVTINIDNDYVDGATVGVGTPPVGENDPIGSLELTGAPAAGQVRVKGWALDPDAPTEALAINVVVGGREGQKGVETYELGQIANQERTDVAASHRWRAPTTASTPPSPRSSPGRSRSASTRSTWRSAATACSAARRRRSRSRSPSPA